MHWVNESAEARNVDYVLYIDADMLLRKPMDPIKLGVRPGVVVSEHVRDPPRPRLTDVAPPRAAARRRAPPGAAAPLSPQPPLARRPVLVF